MTDRGADDASASVEELVTALTDVLVKAVRALGSSGQPVAASRLAGKAWWVLKDWPRQAERVNGTMHYLARLEADGEAGTPADPLENAPVAEGRHPSKG